MLLARCANFSVLIVSYYASRTRAALTQKDDDGVTHAIMAVRALPSSEDCRMRVSFESR